MVNVNRFYKRWLMLATVLTIVLMFFTTLSIARDISIDSKSIHQQEVQSLYDKIDSQWKTKDKITIKCVDQRGFNAEMKKVFQHTIDNVIGFYIIKTKTVVILGTYGDYEGTFYHEYGHVVWDNVLKRSERKAFMHKWVDRLYDQTLVSEYAEYNSEEGFAEEYSTYIRHPLAFSVADEDLYKWFESIKDRVNKDNVNRK